MLGLLPFICCTATTCSAAHDIASATATFVLQLPLNTLHHAAHSTAAATQLLRSKQLKSYPKANTLVSLDAL